MRNKEEIKRLSRKKREVLKALGQHEYVMIDLHRSDNLVFRFDLVSERLEKCNDGTGGTSWSKTFWLGAASSRLDPRGCDLWDRLYQKALDVGLDLKPFCRFQRRNRILSFTYDRRTRSFRSFRSA